MLGSSVFKWSWQEERILEMICNQIIRFETVRFIPSHGPFGMDLIGCK
jgi:hypothetical protein